MRNTPFWDIAIENALMQTPASRKAFLKSAYEGCLKLSKMIEAAR
jgi:hypothetical protein